MRHFNGFFSIAPFPRSLISGAKAQPRAFVATHYLRSRKKRALDIGLVLLFAPLVLPIVLLLSGLIIATTGDSPIFWQRRYGRDRCIFWILKLRTMRQASGADAFLQATHGDHRITRIGSVLRRSSLDELPQLWNVLRGEMSLVGPRPHPVELDEQYLPVISNYHRRFEVRPGLTGLAQVRGARGETATIASMIRRIRYDTKYIANASFRVDLALIWATVAAVLSRKHAY